VNLLLVVSRIIAHEVISSMRRSLNTAIHLARPNTLTYPMGTFLFQLVAAR